MANYDSTQGVVSLDFSSLFPHKFWVSTWSRDEQFPDGFRYMLLSVRQESAGLIQLIGLIEEEDGAKTEMSRLDAIASSVEEILSSVAEEFAVCW